MVAPTLLARTGCIRKWIVVTLCFRSSFIYYFFFFNITASVVMLWTWSVAFNAYVSPGTPALPGTLKSSSNVFYFCRHFSETQQYMPRFNTWRVNSVIRMVSQVKVGRCEIGISRRPHSGPFRLINLSVWILRLRKLHYIASELSWSL